MDRAWNPQLWQQTATQKRVEVQAATLTKSFEAIADRTAEIVKQPYNPGLWASRAELLMRVGYPELAARDARKAQKLLIATLDGKGMGSIARSQLLAVPGRPMPDLMHFHQSFWDDLVKKFHFENFMTLAASLNHAGAHHSFRDMCIEARAMYPGEDIFSGGLASSTAALKALRQALKQSPLFSQINADEQIYFGSVSFRRYPFIPQEYIHRSAEIIASANSRLLAINAPCILRASSLGSSAAPTVQSTPAKTLSPWKSLKQFFGVTESDNLGLFATSAIKKGDIIFKDCTTWAANTLPCVL